MASPAELRKPAHSRGPTQALRFEGGSGPLDVPHRSRSSASLASYSDSPGDLSRSRTIDAQGERSSLTSAERDNGLRRIRQPTCSSRRTSESTPQSYRPAPFTLNISHAQSPSRKNSLTSPSGPPSPVFLSPTDDMQRFPQESLHSFSFTHQADSILHDRQNVLRRSVDFMRDRAGLAAGNTGILDAQARVTGDTELQSMLSLLRRANLVGPSVQDVSTLNTGPLTGPAQYTSDNLFDKSFASESPTEIRSTDGGNVVGETTSAQSSGSAIPPAAPAPNPVLPLDTQTATPSTGDPSPVLGRRSQLKRTFTDIAGYSLQDRLSLALATPYHSTNDSIQPTESIVPPLSATTEPRRGMTLPPGSGPHTHGTRQNAASQAIFTTDSNSPWIIASANDLACLVFGVTKAEVRKMGIMEVIRPESRKWLEKKLRPSGPEQRRSSSRQESPAGHSPSPPPTVAVGSGITAKLLSKPRQPYQSRRSRTAEANSGQSAAKVQHETVVKDEKKSRGVLLCGDVVPIQKRNGAFGSASLWVKEKSGTLIWVMEEIAEDVVLLSLDEIGSVTKGEGAIQAIFGLERVRRGMDVKKLLPQLPKKTGTNTGALDWTLIQATKRYTAHTATDTNVPVTVELLPDEPVIRVSSFPHVAGIMVISSQKFDIVSSNSVFSAALFGLENPDGKNITELIPYFDKYLEFISDEDTPELRDGIVIPEHSFRRARALIAMREGHEDATTIFLHPNGLPAKHRDGSEIMIDVQLRVVKSGFKPVQPPTTINEDDEAIVMTNDSPSTVSYALWITYSKQLHSVKPSLGVNTPMLMSRPGTPPHQPSPGQASPPINGNSDSGVESAPPQSPDPNALAQQLHEASSSPLTQTLSAGAEPFEHPSPAAVAAGVKVVKKKAISDFVILQEMGKGAYGEVKLVRWKKTQPGNTMVIKYVTKRRILVDTWTRDRKLGTVPLEIHVLDYLRRDGLQHNHIVEMVDFFEDDINYYIEMLPHGMPGMDLFDWIEMKPHMNQDDCRNIFKQIADGLYHLHIKARVVHRDIKDENIILDGDGNVKIADFGSAAYIKSGPFDVFVGTLDYAAPEVLRGLPYRGKEQDVWALGILLYTIIYKENPFYNVDEIMDHDLRVPYVMSEDALDLIRKMLDRDVERRIGISDVVRHKWCVPYAGDSNNNGGAATGVGTEAGAGIGINGGLPASVSNISLGSGAAASLVSDTSEVLPKVVQVEDNDATLLEGRRDGLEAE